MIGIIYKTLNPNSLDNFFVDNINNVANIIEIAVELFLSYLGL